MAICQRKINAIQIPANRSLTNSPRQPLRASRPRLSFDALCESLRPQCLARYFSPDLGFLRLAFFRPLLFAAVVANLSLHSVAASLSAVRTATFTPHAALPNMPTAQQSAAPLFARSQSREIPISSPSANPSPSNDSALPPDRLPQSCPRSIHVNPENVRARHPHTQLLLQVRGAFPAERQRHDPQNSQQNLHFQSRRFSCSQILQNACEENPA